MVFPPFLLAPIHCFGEKKSKRRHLCFSCLCAGWHLLFGLWWESVSQAQGTGVRGSFAFSSQGSRVCLLQESEKALLVLLFFLPLEEIWRGNPPSPQGWLWMCTLWAGTQELLSQEAPWKVRAPGEGGPLSSRDTPPYCYFKKLRKRKSQEFWRLWLLREFLKTGLYHERICFTHQT